MARLWSFYFTNLTYIFPDVVGITIRAALFIYFLFGLKHVCVILGVEMEIKLVVSANNVCLQSFLY